MNTVNIKQSYQFQVRPEDICCYLLAQYFYTKQCVS